jgi:hypothetical protein
MIKWNKRAWERAVKKYGKKTMILGLATMPVWLPIWLVLMALSITLQLLGSFGETIERKIN